MSSPLFRAIPLLAVCAALSAQATNLTVTTTADNQANPPPGSLRAAILAANQARGSATNPITITFAAGLIGQTITLAAQLPILNASFVTITAPVTNQAQRVIVDANVQNGSFLITGNDVTMRYVRIRGGQLDTLSLYGCARATFEFCDLQGTGEGACYSVGAPQTTFRDCLFDGGTGLGMLTVDGGDGLRVERCTFQNYPNSAGLTCTGTANVVVTGSTFTGCGNGLQLIEVCQNAVIGPGNLIASNKVYGFVATLAVNLQVVGTTFRANGGWGAYLQDRTADTVIDGCTFDQNGIGSTSIAPGSSQLVLSDDLRTRILRTNFTAGYGTAIETLGSQGLRIEPTAPACQITGHRGHALKVQNGSAGLRCDLVSMQGNCTTYTAPQVLFTDSRDLLLTRCTISGSPQGGLQTVRCSNVTVTAGTQIVNNGRDALTIGDSSDIVFGPRNVLDPVEIGCTITGNGGGIAFDRAVDCKIQGNTVLGGGGTTFSGNTQPITIGTSCQNVVLGPGFTVTTPSSTAIVVTGSANQSKIQGCIVSGYTGNAIFVSNATNTEVRGCALTGSASSGAGVLVDRGNGTSLFGTIVANNGGQGIVIQDSANVLVGPGNVVKRNRREGILVQQGGGALPTSVTMESTQVTNNAVGFANTAGVMIRNATLKMVNCTVASASSPGHWWNLYVANTATATVANSVFWGAGFSDRFLQAGSSTMDYSIYGTQAGSATWGTILGNNVVSDPLFANLVSDDVHIGATSPAKHTGVNAPSGVALPSVDYEGDPRVICTTVDRGADERVLPCVLGNSLHLAGEWLREPGDSLLRLDLDAPTQAGRSALLLASLAGATNGVPLRLGAVLPLEPDALTVAFLAAPAIAVLPLDAQGRATTTIAVPVEVQAALGREIAFAFTVVPALDFASNPVVVRFFQ